jgi:hypothetical protein
MRGEGNEHITNPFDDAGCGLRAAGYGPASRIGSSLPLPELEHS